MFVTRGAYVTSVTGENNFIAQPVAVLNPPGIWHRDHFVGGRGSFMTVDLEIDDLAEDRALHALDPKILQHCTRLAASLEHANSLAVEDAVDLLARLFREKKPNDLAGVPASIERAYEAIMDSQEPWLLTMEGLARIAGVHPNHLPRAFRSRFGITASMLAAARQVELCGRALSQSSEPLADIAAEFGFCDQAHMSTRFRQLANSTPGAWRKKSMPG